MKRAFIYLIICFLLTIVANALTSCYSPKEVIQAKVRDFVLIKMEDPVLHGEKYIVWCHWWCDEKKFEVITPEDFPTTHYLGEPKQYLDKR